MRNTPRMTLAGCLITAVVAVAVAEDKTKPLDEATFVKKAAMGGMHEVELGKMAGTMATNPEVKKFADRMVTDHTKANQELMDFAKSMSLPLPGKMSAKTTKEMEKFKSYKGTEFDKAYMKHMVMDHKMDIDLFTKASKELKDEKLKAFADKTLPTLKEHGDMATKLNDSLGKE